MDGKIVFHVFILYFFFWRKSTRLTIFLVDDKIDFHVPPPSYSLRYSCGFCVSVNTYNIRFFLHQPLIFIIVVLSVYVYLPVFCNCIEMFRSGGRNTKDLLKNGTFGVNTTNYF